MKSLPSRSERKGTAQAGLAHFRSIRHVPVFSSNNRARVHRVMHSTGRSRSRSINGISMTLRHLAGCFLHSYFAARAARRSLGVFAELLSSVDTLASRLQEQGNKKEKRGN